MLFGVGRPPDFAPAIALIFLFRLLVFVVVLRRVISSVHLILMIVVMKWAVIVLHQVTWNILGRRTTQGWVAQVHQEGALVNDLCTWKWKRSGKSHSMNHLVKCALSERLASSFKYASKWNGATTKRRKHMATSWTNSLHRRSKNNFVLFYCSIRLSRDICISLSLSQRDLTQFCPPWQSVIKLHAKYFLLRVRETKRFDNWAHKRFFFTSSSELASFFHLLLHNLRVENFELFYQKFVEPKNSRSLARNTKVVRR